MVQNGPKASKSIQKRPKASKSVQKLTQVSISFQKRPKATKSKKETKIMAVLLPPLFPLLLKFFWYLFILRHPPSLLILLYLVSLIFILVLLEQYICWKAHTAWPSCTLVMLTLKYLNTYICCRVVLFIWLV